MKENFDKCFAYLLPIEGGYTNDPHDPGGATNLGVIQSEYNAYRSRNNLGIQSVKFITRAEASEIYKTQYWAHISGDLLPSGVDWIVFDSAVNSGVRQSSLWLQRAINNTIKGTGYGSITVDGTIGLETVHRALDAYDFNSKYLINSIHDQRLSMLQHLKNWAYFGRGWKARVEEVTKQACEMVVKIPLRVPQYEFETYKLPWYDRLWAWIKGLFI